MKNLSKNEEKPRSGVEGEAPSPRSGVEGATQAPTKDPSWATFGIYGAVGIQLALTVVAGWFIGNYFDNRWETSPWLALLGLVLGFVGGFINLIRILNWRQKKQ